LGNAFRHRREDLPPVPTKEEDEDEDEEDEDEEDEEEIGAGPLGLAARDRLR